MRARAFHVIDPKGFVEMLILFLEEKGVGVVTPPFLDESKVHPQFHSFFFQIIISFLVEIIYISFLTSFFRFRTMAAGSLRFLVHGKVTP